MGFLGDEYFRSSPDDPLWSEDGSRAWRYRYGHEGRVDHSRCNVRRGEGFSWCITHWIPLFGFQTTEEKALSDLRIACEHCSEKLPSKGELKKHMKKAHKDVLEAQRKAYEDPQQRGS